MLDKGFDEKLDLFTDIFCPNRAVIFQNHEGIEIKSRRLAFEQVGTEGENEGNLYWSN
jgi:hypothetical protein